jgi:hypothetical protein
MKSTTKFDLSFDNLYSITEDYQIENLTNAIEELVRTKNLEELVTLTETIVSFVNENHECSWMLVAIDQYLVELYNTLDNEYCENETEENKELYDFISEFITYKREDGLPSYSDIISKNLKFNPEKEFTVYFNPERNSDEYWRSNKDWLWSKEQGGEEMTFPELIIKEAGLKWTTTEEYTPGFDFENEKDWKTYKHRAITSLWLGLRKYADEFPDAEDMAICLWTVFDDALEEMQGTGTNFEIVKTIFTKILYVDFDSYNSDDTDDEDLNTFDSYVHDFEKLAQEILDKDIFDLSPYGWGQEN